jgi:hypothetical protein
MFWRAFLFVSLSAQISVAQAQAIHLLVIQQTGDAVPGMQRGTITRVGLPQREETILGAVSDAIVGIGASAINYQGDVAFSTTSTSGSFRILLARAMR